MNMKYITKIKFHIAWILLTEITWMNKKLDFCNISATIDLNNILRVLHSFKTKLIELLVLKS